MIDIVTWIGTEASFLTYRFDFGMHTRWGDELAGERFVMRQDVAFEFWFVACCETMAKRIADARGIFPKVSWVI